MKFLLYFTLTLFCLFIPFLVPAQQIPTELQALIAQAQEHSPTVRQGILQEQAQRLRTADTKSNLLPTINGTANYTYLNPVSKVQFGDQVLSFVPMSNYDAHLSLSQQLLDFGRTKTALRSALEQEASARTTTESVKHLISYQVAQTYYGMVFLRQSIAVQDTILASLGENARTINVKIQQGNAIDLDRLNTQSQIDQTRDRRTDLVNQLNKQMASMEYLVGNRPNVAANTGFDFHLADTTGLGTGTGNYDVRLAKSQVTISEANQTLQTKVYKPTLVASVQGGAKNGYLRPGLAPSDALYQFRPNLAAGATFNLPIYTGGRNDRAQQLAATQTAIAKAQQDEARDAYRRDLASTLSDRDGAALKLRNAASQVAQAARALQLSKARYRNGAATNLDVLTSNDLFQQAKLSQVNAQYQLALAELEIARLSGYSLK